LSSPSGHNQVIELFPSGGGGYKVATSLIGPNTGLVSGAALIVDYILTMAISVARYADGAFSPLPVAAWSFKLRIALGLAPGIDHFFDRRCNNFNFGALRSIFWLTQTDPPPI